MEKVKFYSFWLRQESGAEKVVETKRRRYPGKSGGGRGLRRPSVIIGPCKPVGKRHHYLFYIPKGETLGEREKNLGGAGQSIRIFRGGGDTTKKSRARTAIHPLPVYNPGWTGTPTKGERKKGTPRVNLTGGESVREGLRDLKELWLLGLLDPVKGKVTSLEVLIVAQKKEEKCYFKKMMSFTRSSREGGRATKVRQSSC